MTHIVGVLARKAGPGGSVVTITADHGMPPEPAAGRRHYSDEVVALIHNRFDPTEKKLVQYYADAANYQMYIDSGRLRSLGITLKDIVALLESRDFYAAAFTEDDVRAAQASLSSMK
jgi:hypothetical protein